IMHLAAIFLAATLFTPADYLAVRTANFTAVSPDGKQVAWSVSEPDAGQGVRRQSVWVAGADGANARQLFRVDAQFESPRAPQWSPDGRWIAASVGLSIHAEQLLLADVARGTSRALTAENVNVNGWTWSSDSKRLAVLEQRARSDEKPHAPRVVAPPKDEPPHIEMYDLAAGTSKRLDLGALVADDLAWSPDGTRIAFSSAGDLYVVPAAGGAPQRLTSDDAREIKPRWSPDGSQLLFAYVAARGEPVMLGAMPLSGGAPRAVAEQFPTWIINDEPRFYAWAADGRSIYFAGIAHQSQQLYQALLADGSVRPVTNVPGSAYGFSLSTDAKTFAFVASDPAHAGEIFVARLPTAQPKQISNLNPQLTAFRFGKTETFAWTSGDGTALEGLLMFPPDHDPSRRYPMVVLMEGTYGTFDRSFTGRVSADTIWQTHFPFVQHAFAARGFVVFMPNPRGSWGFGVELQRKARGDFGVGPYNDIISGIDALVARNIADPDRLGIMGSGFDSYRTAYAISQTPRFKAAAVVDVEFDLVSLYGAVPPGFRGFFERMLGGPPWKSMDTYIRLSPLTNADKIRTPTLILHAADAPGASQSDEMAAALAVNNIAYEHVSYPTGNWTISDSTMLLDAMQRNVEWFAKWLQ
ncbi:MAG TPA: prolyl oligopeptidase family serine peptidase, partial [Thermoanaerobaculia bacterium]|nr:prolyl oligopeptidase family serine peptidase [Thermoanaerobaculia bacterium]